MSNEGELAIEIDEEAYEVKAIKAFLAEEISVEDLQVSLELGRAQTYRLVKRYKCEGPNGVVSRNMGNRNRAYPEAERERIVSIVRERYPDFGPTLAAEKLKEIHGIQLASKHSAAG